MFIIDAETGDQDEECGVHALFHLTGIFWEWRGLDHLFSHPFRPIHDRTYKLILIIYIIVLI